MKIKRHIPSFIKKIIKKTSSNSVKKNEVIEKTIELKFCPICNKEVEIINLPFFYFEKFYEHGFVYSPFQLETLNVKNYSCKNCGASDRDRLIALYLKKYLRNNKNKISLLDFAPSVSLSKFIKGFNLIYRSADLFMQNVDDKVDIKDMDIYDDNTFDIFICSHVLEHVKDDIKAMKELYRITKKNGIGICLVPIMLSIEKSEENEKYLKSEHLRWKHFGQNDHVRMYSKNDFVSRLRGVGFKVNEYGSEYFGEDIFKGNGIDIKSVLYVVEKEE